MTRRERILGQLRHLGLAGVHWLGFAVFYLLLHPAEPGEIPTFRQIWHNRRWTPPVADSFDGEKKQDIVRSVAARAPIHPAFRPVILYRYDEFIGQGTLVALKGAPPFVVASRHEFTNGEWRGQYSCEILSPRSPLRFPIHAFEVAPDSSYDVAVWRLGKTRWLSIASDFEHLGDQGSGRFCPVDCIHLKSLVTGKSYRSSLEWQPSPPHPSRTRRVCFPDRLIGYGESGSGFVDEAGNLYIMVYALTLDPETRASLRLQRGVRIPVGAPWIVYLEKFDPTQFLAP